MDEALARTTGGAGGNHHTESRTTQLLEAAGQGLSLGNHGMAREVHYHSINGSRRTALAYWMELNSKLL